MIAYELGVTESAIKAHVTAILCKLQVRNRAQVIAAAAPLERFESLQLETTLAPGGRSAMSGPAQIRCSETHRRRPRMTNEVIGTHEALKLLAEIVADHGQVLFRQSGGCCDGSSPMC